MQPYPALFSVSYTQTNLESRGNENQSGRLANASCEEGNPPLILLAPGPFTTSCGLPRRRSRRHHHRSVFLLRHRSPFLRRQSAFRHRSRSPFRTCRHRHRLCRAAAVQTARPVKHAVQRLRLVDASLARARSQAPALAPEAVHASVLGERVASCVTVPTVHSASCMEGNIQ